jgi:hypothetical protein
MISCAICGCNWKSDVGLICPACASHARNLDALLAEPGGSAYVLNRLVGTGAIPQCVLDAVKSRIEMFGIIKKSSSNQSYSNVNYIVKTLKNFLKLIIVQGE